MKKFVIQVIALLIVIFGALTLGFSEGKINIPLIGNNQSETTATIRQAQIGNTALVVEIADTPALRSQGLANKTALDPNNGILFIFDNSAKHRFWMKDVSFPVDIIWLLDSKVVDIIKNVPAGVGIASENLPIYEPLSAVNMALEVNAGFTDQHDIKVGDQFILISN